MSKSVAMAPRWETQTFAEGRRVAILAGDGSIRFASNEAELEPPTTKKQPFTRAEWQRIDQIFREHDARARKAA